MMNLDNEKLEDKPEREGQMVDSKEEEGSMQEVVDAIEDELTDEQLLQMAEGTCSWGANCNKGSTC